MQVAPAGHRPGVDHQPSAVGRLELEPDGRRSGVAATGRERQRGSQADALDGCRYGTELRHDGDAKRGVEALLAGVQSDHHGGHGDRPEREVQGKRRVQPGAAAEEDAAPARPTDPELELRPQAVGRQDLAEEAVAGGRGHHDCGAARLGQDLDVVSLRAEAGRERRPERAHLQPRRTRVCAEHERRARRARQLQRLQPDLHVSLRARRDDESAGADREAADAASEAAFELPAAHDAVDLEPSPWHDDKAKRAGLLRAQREARPELGAGRAGAGLGGQREHPPREREAGRRERRRAVRIKPVDRARAERRQEPRDARKQPRRRRLGLRLAREPVR